MKGIFFGFLVLLLLNAPPAVRAQFIYTTNSDGATLTVTGYTGASDAVTIPATINGLTVTSIGVNALALQSLTLTNGLCYFGDPQWTNYPGRYYRINE
ncbi:MAG: hypothetical protein ACLQVW_25530 [Limisphaerales bacterium]